MSSTQALDQLSNRCTTNCQLAAGFLGKPAEIHHVGEREQRRTGRSPFIQAHPALMSKLKRPLLIAALGILVILLGGCHQRSKPRDGAAAVASPSSGSDGALLPATPTMMSGTLIPITDLKTDEALQINQPWTGDFDEISNRRFIRALVAANKTTYYADGAKLLGFAHDSLLEFEKTLRSISARGKIAPKIVIIPTSRDRLLPSLVAGYGDIAIGNLTITPEREKIVDFSDPVFDNVQELVVTGPLAPPISSIDDLSGKQALVRASSSYHESLKLLNEYFRREGKSPVTIRFADELLEDEDIIQLVDAGVIDITILDSHIAKFWSQLYDRAKVHEDLALRTGGHIAWAFRKNSSQFKGLINDFVRTHREGTLFGNILLKRYLGNPDRLKNPTSQAEMKRFREVVRFFHKYADKYGLPWLLVVAQAYQESGLDQSRRSPAGAIGIMQIKPDTAADPSVGIPNIYIAENNIHAGVKYMRFIIDQYYKD